MCVFLLCINRFRLREFGNKILLAGVLFSLSLAAYGLLVGAVIIYFIQMRKIIWIIVFGSLFATVGIISYFYNNGDNVLYQMIFHRIEFEDGEMVGNNRTSMYFDAEFDKYLSSSKVWTGMGRDAFGSEKMPIKTLRLDVLVTNDISLSEGYWVQCCYCCFWWLIIGIIALFGLWAS